MPTFERGDIVAVPFPYVEHPVTQRRPALVVSQPLGPKGALLWVMMITGATNEAWPGDVAISTRSDSSGLRMPSVVRTAKVTTIEGRSAQGIGKLGKADLTKVDLALDANLSR